MSNTTSNVIRIGARPVEPIARPLLLDEVVRRMRTLIVEGTLMPGSRIPERQLCSQLGISRTPLREAFRVLAGEGLIEIQPHRGATVCKLNAAEVDHIFQVMEALESLAGELACDEIPDEEIAAIRDLHEKMMSSYKRRQKAAFFKLNQQIHERIMRASGNPVLARIYEGLSGQMRRARYMSLNTDTQWEQAVMEHEGIMTALEARDKQALGHMLRLHLRNKRAKVKAILTSEAPHQLVRSTKPAKVS
jgi:DNA-binding GntR family transcriptional regulator